MWGEVVGGFDSVNDWPKVMGDGLAKVDGDIVAKPGDEFGCWSGFRHHSVETGDVNGDYGRWLFRVEQHACYPPLEPPQLRTRRNIRYQECNDI